MPGRFAKFLWDIYADIALTLALLTFAAWYSADSLWRISGIALSILSMALWVRARSDLGSAFSVAPQARELMTRGLYSKIRHPIYLFSSVAFGGILITLGRPLACLLLIPFAAFQYARALAEDTVLRKAFGERYEAWRQRTWF